jgi:hypothetical protein
MVWLTGAGQHVNTSAVPNASIDPKHGVLVPNTAAAAKPHA